jgi:hypothetical protein
MRRSRIFRTSSSISIHCRRYECALVLGRDSSGGNYKPPTSTAYEGGVVSVSCCEEISMNRKYLPTFAELVDRLSIVLLKQIFLPELRGAYKDEAGDIMHDLNECRGVVLTAVDLHAIIMLALVNREIWLNEAAARKGGGADDSRLRFTHSINGIRSKAKNILSERRGDRMDMKVDSYAADLPSEYGEWDVWK